MEAEFFTYLLIQEQDNIKAVSLGLNTEETLSLSINYFETIYGKGNVKTGVKTYVYTN